MVRRAAPLAHPLPTCLQLVQLFKHQPHIGCRQHRLHGSRRAEKLQQQLQDLCHCCRAWPLPCCRLMLAACTCCQCMLLQASGKRMGCPAHCRPCCCCIGGRCWLGAGTNQGLPLEAQHRQQASKSCSPHMRQVSIHRCRSGLGRGGSLIHASHVLQRWLQQAAVLVRAALAEHQSQQARHEQVTVKRRVPTCMIGKWTGRQSGIGTAAMIVGWLTSKQHDKLLRTSHRTSHQRSSESSPAAAKACTSAPSSCSTTSLPSSVGSTSSPHVSRRSRAAAALLLPRARSARTSSTAAGRAGETRPLATMLRSGLGLPA